MLLYLHTLRGFLLSPVGLMNALSFLSVIMRYFTTVQEELNNYIYIFEVIFIYMYEKVWFAFGVMGMSLGENLNRAWKRLVDNGGTNCTTIDVQKSNFYLVITHSSNKYQIPVQNVKSVTYYQ